MSGSPRYKGRRCDFHWFQGQNKTINIRATEAVPDPYCGEAIVGLDITDYTVIMSVRESTIDNKDNDLAPEAAKLTSDNVNEIAKEDQTQDDTRGRAKIYWRTAVSKYLRPGCYNYRVYMVDTFGEETPLLVGEIYLEASV